MTDEIAQSLVDLRVPVDSLVCGFDCGYSQPDCSGGGFVFACFLACPGGDIAGEVVGDESRTARSEVCRIAMCFHVIINERRGS